MTRLRSLALTMLLLCAMLANPAWAQKRTALTFDDDLATALKAKGWTLVTADAAYADPIGPTRVLKTQVATPSTVHGQALGGVEQFQNERPARIWLENASIDLVPGEAATLQYAGLHSATLRITSEDGFVDVRHGDHWAALSGRRKRISSRGNGLIERVRRGASWNMLPTPLPNIRTEDSCRSSA